MIANDPGGQREDGRLGCKDLPSARRGREGCSDQAGGVFRRHGTRAQHDEHEVGEVHPQQTSPGHVDERHLRERLATGDAGGHQEDGS